MPIVFACVTPHPPIMVPEVGGGREAQVSASIDAMRRLAEELSVCKPDALCIVSPHGAFFPDAMGILVGSHSVGSLAEWSYQAAHLTYIFPNDAGLVRCVQDEASRLEVPIRPFGERGYDLDHGVTVPMYFLAEKVRGLPLVVLSFSGLPLEAHLRFGQAVRRAADASGKRVAFIASGDLSHRLTHDAPAGYHPLGKEFDSQVVDVLRCLDRDAILALDPTLVDCAGECGLRSIAILLGALDGLDVEGGVLSYEGPFGVGYPVAAYRVKGPATTR